MYSGPVECPKCDLPLEVGTQICPYCHSTAPASAPWNYGAWSNVAIIAAIVVVLLGVDACLGTKILPAIWSSIQANDT